MVEGEEGAVSVMSEDFSLLINQQTADNSENFMNSNHFNFGIEPDTNEPTTRNTACMPSNFDYFKDPEKGKNAKDEQDSKDPVYEADEEDPETEEEKRFSHLEAASEEEPSRPEEDKKHQEEQKHGEEVVAKANLEQEEEEDEEELDSSEEEKTREIVVQAMAELEALEQLGKPESLLEKRSKTMGPEFHIGTTKEMKKNESDPWLNI